jgi:hypothetical protein
MTLSTIEGGSNMPKEGPATQEGKEVVKWNAVQHGVRSPAPLVPGMERAGVSLALGALASLTCDVF